MKTYNIEKHITRQIPKRIIKLLTNIYFWVLLIAFTIVRLLYSIYIKNHTIEGLDINTTITDSVNPLKPIFSVGLLKNFFQPKCLAGCISPTKKGDNCSIEQVKNFNNNFNKCPWVCNSKEFDTDQDLNTSYTDYFNKGYKKCASDTDCGACIPYKYFL